MNQNATPDGGDAPSEERDDVLDAEPEEPEEGWLDKVPESLVHLGAGFLLASTLVTAAFALYGWYSVATGQTHGFPVYRVIQLSLAFTFMTIVHAAATRWARQQTKWLWVMLAAILGMVLLVSAPLNLLAIVCLGLGKRHFSAHTPADELMESLRGSGEDGSDDE